MILANINIANTCALIGAAFYGLTFLVPTMVRLRVYGIFSAVFFMAYGVLAGVISTFLMYFLLLPINSFRLYQIVKLLKKARVAVQGDLSIDWLKPFMAARNYKKGDLLFRKGDVANEMYLTVSGKFLVNEIGVELPPGRLLGELGFVSPNNARTQSVECIEDGTVMTISYDRLLEVYFALSGFRLFLPAAVERAPAAEHRAAGGVGRAVQDAACPVAGRRRGQSARRAIGLGRAPDSLPAGRKPVKIRGLPGPARGESGRGFR